MTAFHAPGGPGVRMDSALYAGYTVPPYYDSLIAKLIVHDVDRATCIRRLERCLGEVVIDGIPSSVPLLRAIFATDDVRQGEFDTGWLGRFLAGWSELSAMMRMPAGIGLARPDAELLLSAYAAGIFPMAEDSRQPDRPLDRAASGAGSCRSTRFHVPRSLRKVIRRGRHRDPRRHRLRSA